MSQDPRRGPIVVVSPHLDDGVLSLGASIASWARAGMAVELLTVFACDPESSAPAGGWDSRAGFGTEGEAARARRVEDAGACARLEAAPRWLAFGDVDYERRRDEQAVGGAVLAAVEGAGTVLVPGFPLTHPDHVWLTQVLLRAPLPVRLGFYAEQPYSIRSESSPELPGWVAEAVGAAEFKAVDAAVRDSLAKWRAIREYRSQLPLLALDARFGRDLTKLAFWAEEVAWVDSGAGRGPH